jgi:hypothetical protein
MFMRLLPLQHADRNVKAAGYIQLYAMPPGINQHAISKLPARLIGEPGEPCDILGPHSSRAFDLTPLMTPDYAHDEIYLNLIFVR